MFIQLNTHLIVHAQQTEYDVFILINLPVCWLKCSLLAPTTAAVVPALITVNVATVVIILSLVVTVVFIVWCCVIKKQKINSKLKQQ